MLGSKLHDHDWQIPFYDDFIKSSRRANFKVEEYHQTEKFIVVEILNWELNSVIPLQCLEILISQGILFENDSYEGIESQEHTLDRVEQSRVFADLILDCPELYHLMMPPTLIALSCVIASR